MGPIRHALVVADSCFSGTMTRASGAELRGSLTRDAYLRKLHEKMSRVLIASGGNEPVADGGARDHSLFAAVFLRTLRDPFDQVFTAEEMMSRQLKEAVAGRMDQTPEYKVIRNSGHDGGDFIFIRKEGLAGSPDEDRSAGRRAQDRSPAIRAATGPAPAPAVRTATRALTPEDLMRSLRAGRFQEALDGAQASEATPAQLAVLRLFAEAGILRDTRKFGAARARFERIATAFPEYREVARYWLCTMYRLENRNADAADCFEREGLKE